MNCPACGQALDESAAACESCGQDARLTMMTPQATVYGPYTLAEVRTFAELGRVPIGSTLHTMNGQTLTLPQVGLGTIVADAAFAGPVRTGGLSKGVKWGIAALVLAVALPVVGIGVAMMAGVGTTAFKAQGQAQESMCQQHLAQLAMSVQFYVEDHEGVLPNAATWKQDIMPYLWGDPSTFECPSSGRGQASYKLNTAVSGRTMASIRNRGKTAMIYEAGLLEGSGPHRGGGHVAYVDGHVEWVSASDF